MHMKRNFFCLVYHKQTQEKTYLMFISKHDPRKYFLICVKERDSAVAGGSAKTRPKHVIFHM